MARYLLKLGFRIVDIKPQKENPHRTVFVFEDDGDGRLKEAMREFKPR